MTQDYKKSPSLTILEEENNLRLAEIDSSNFNNTKYFRENFTSGKGDIFLIDTEKILRSLSVYHQIQGETVEKISNSIEEDPKALAEIGKKFQSLKPGLINSFTSYYSLIDTVRNTKGIYEEKYKYLSSILDSYKKISKIERAYKSAHEILNILEELQTALPFEEFTEDFLEEEMKRRCWLLNSARKEYEYIKISDMIVKEFENKFQLKALINYQRDFLLEYLKMDLTAFLTDNQFLDVYNQDLSLLHEYMTRFELLDSHKACEKIFSDLVLVPLIFPISKNFDEKANSTVSKIHFTISEFYDQVIILFKNPTFTSIEEMFRSYHKVEATTSREYNLPQLLWKSVLTVLAPLSIPIRSPAEFLSTFRATHRFWNILSSKLFSKESKKVYWNDTSKHDFLKRWDLKGYFGTRFQELTSDLMKSYKDEKLVQYSGEYIHIKHDKDIKKFISDCLKAEIFLVELAPQFLGLSFQIIQFFCKRLDEFYVKHCSKKEFSDPIARLLINFLTDLVILKKFTKEILLNEINHAFEFDLTVRKENIVICPKEKNEEFTKQIEVSLTTFMAPFEAALGKSLAPSCQENLEPMMSVVVSLRMGGKGLPNHPSNYLNNIFTPLSLYLQKKNIPNECHQRIARTTIKLTYTKFLQMIQEVLKKAEDYEKQFMAQNKGKVDISDLEKIKHQFNLDNEEFGNIVNRQFGVTHDMFDFQRL